VAVGGVVGVAEAGVEAGAQELKSKSTITPSFHIWTRGCFRVEDVIVGLSLSKSSDVIDCVKEIWPASSGNGLERHFSKLS
jgi:hypothetical protein